MSYSFKSIEQKCPPEFPDQLAARGAVLSFENDVRPPMLVGEWSWLNDREVFVFPAHGDAGDERVVECDEAVLLDTQIVGLKRRGSLVAQLAAINAAGLQDPDDYRVAWQIWQQVAPLVRDKIIALRESLEDDVDDGMARA